METNNYSPYYNAPSASSPVPNFLPMAIVAIALSAFPIAGIVAIILGAANKGRINDYLANGGVRTGKIRVSSILSNVGLWLGLGMTIFYALYFIFLFGLVAYITK